MSISNATRQAYAEIDEFLELLSEEQRNKIPKKLKLLFQTKKDHEYRKGINPKIPIIQQELKQETLGIIALLNLQYWCDDKIEKDRLKNVYDRNERMCLERQREKYNSENIFKKNQSQIERIDRVEKGETAIVKYKESIFTRCIKRIKNLVNNINIGKHK